MNEKIALLQQWIDESERIVFFGGAGVSTGSGIPDYRSASGKYAQEWEYPLEVILSHDMLVRDPSVYYRYYRSDFQEAKPNVVHTYLAELERAGRLAAVITQNIDGLHQAAGSERVYELHGSVYRYHCMACGSAHTKEFVDRAEEVPLCACGGVVRPDVVFFGEQLDDDVVMGAVLAISDADLLIVGGTSLVVYPAAGLIDYYKGNRLALLNRDATAYDSHANLRITDDLVEVFSALCIPERSQGSST